MELGRWAPEADEIAYTPVVNAGRNIDQHAEPARAFLQRISQLIERGEEQKNQLEAAPSQTTEEAVEIITATRQLLRDMESMQTSQQSSLEIMHALELMRRILRQKLYEYGNANGISEHRVLTQKRTPSQMTATSGVVEAREYQRNLARARHGRERHPLLSTERWLQNHLPQVTSLFRAPQLSQAA